METSLAIHITSYSLMTGFPYVFPRPTNRDLSFFFPHFSRPWGWIGTAAAESEGGWWMTEKIEKSLGISRCLIFKHLVSGETSCLFSIWSWFDIDVFFDIYSQCNAFVRDILLLLLRSFLKSCMRTMTVTAQPVPLCTKNNMKVMSLVVIVPRIETDFANKRTKFTTSTSTNHHHQHSNYPPPRMQSSPTRMTWYFLGLWIPICKP